MHLQSRLLNQTVRIACAHLLKRGLHAQLLICLNPFCTVSSAATPNQHLPQHALMTRSQMQDGVDLRDMQVERAIPNGHLCAFRAHAVAR